MQSSEHIPTAQCRRLSFWQVWALFALMLASHGLLLFIANLHSSATYDEGPHLAAGLAYWREGEMSIYNLSPPLMRYWAAAPAFWSGVDLPIARRDRDLPAKERSWAYFNDVQHANPGRVHHLVMLGRIACWPLSLGVAWLIFGWSRRLFGDAGGLISCAAWCFSPVVIAQASGLNTDIGCTLSMCITVWLWQRFVDRPNVPRTLLLSAAFAAAQAMKFTALLLIPLLLLLAAWSVWRRRLRFAEAFSALALCGVIGFVTFNAMYRFRLMGDALGDFHFASHTMQRLQAALPYALPMPFSRDAVGGFDAQKFEAEGAYATTLFDHAYFGSDWRFYPMQLISTETPGLLVLLGLMIASMAWAPPRGEQGLILIVLVVFVLGFTALARINISLRYLLPAYPLAAVMIGRCAARGWSLRCAVLAMAMMIAETALATPRFHSYSNALLGPSRNWRTDADVGQSLIAVARWQKDNPQLRATVLYAGTIDLSEYGVVDAANLDEADVVIVSKTLLAGLPVRTGHGFIFLRCWRELRAQKPLADLDGMIVYSIDQVRSAGVAPWQRPVANWSDYWADEKSIPFPNHEQ